MFERGIRELNKDIQDYSDRVERIKRMMIPTIIITVSILPVFLKLFLAKYEFGYEYLLAGIGVFIGYIYFFYEMFAGKYLRRKRSAEKEIQIINTKLDQVKSELEKYETLYLTEKDRLYI